MRKNQWCLITVLSLLIHSEAFAGQWDDVLASASVQTGQTVNDGGIFNYSATCSGTFSNLTPVSAGDGVSFFSPTDCTNTAIFFVSLQEVARQRDMAALQLQSSVNSDGITFLQSQASVASSGIAQLQADLTVLQLQTSTQFSATNGAVALLQADLASFRSEINSQITAMNAAFSSLQRAQIETNKRAWIGSALAASLVSVAPVEGTSNRLGMNVATVQGQTAVSVNYARVSGAVDLNAGVAVNTSDSQYAIARVGAGFSW